MKCILFFETPEFTGATRVTRSIAKKVSGHFETKFAIIRNVGSPCEEIREIIEKEEPDIIFSSFSCINPDVIIVGKEKRLIVVVRQDYKIRDLLNDQISNLIETYPLADWVIVQTPEMRQELLSYGSLQKCNIKVIENPLDEEDILEKANMPTPFLDNGLFHFLWVGRKDPIKDLPTLQKAFEIVHKRYPNTDLTLVSDDPNPYRWMKYADCMVISSKSEASPNVLREALFLGTRVVSTDCSPTVRLLVPSEYIVPIGDYIGLAEILGNIIINRFK